MVRERLAKTLSIAWVKLREAQQQQQQQVAAASPSATSSASGDAAGRPASEEAEAQWKFGLTRNMQQALQVQRTVTGLQSCVMSLLRLLLIVDFF